MKSWPRMPCLRSYACAVVLLASALAGAGEVAAQPTVVAAQDAKPSAHNVNLSVGHTLTRDDARTRVEQLLAYWGKRFGVKSEWTGFRVSLSGIVWGVSIDAHFDVSDHDVSATAVDPGFAWRHVAQDYVSKKLKKYLHPSYQEP